MTGPELKLEIRQILVSRRTIVQEIQALDMIIDFIAQMATDGIPAWTFDAVFNQDGTGAGAFCTYTDTSGALRFWNSKINGNVNHAPPNNPAVTENDYWKEVSPATGSAIKAYAPGLIGPGLFICYHNDGKPAFYVLKDDVVRPFNSTDLLAELTEGKWIKFGGGDLQNGSGTTFDGEGVDLGGVLTEDFILDADGFDVLMSGASVFEFVANDLDLNALIISDDNFSMSKETAIGEGYGVSIGGDFDYTYLYANDGMGIESHIKLFNDGNLNISADDQLNMMAEGISMETPFFSMEINDADIEIMNTGTEFGRFSVFTYTGTSTLPALDHRGRFIMDEDEVSLLAQNAVLLSVGHIAGLRFEADEADGYFIDSRALAKGVEYFNESYADNFTDLSLPHVKWVKKKVITDYVASHTLTLANWRALLRMNNAGALTLTVPKDATLNVPVGYWIDGSQWGAGQITIAPEDGTINVHSAGGRLKTTAQFSGFTLVKVAPNEWLAVGDLTA